MVERALTWGGLETWIPIQPGLALSQMLSTPGSLRMSLSSKEVTGVWFLSSCTASDLHPGPVQGSCQDGEPRKCSPTVQRRGEGEGGVVAIPSLQLCLGSERHRSLAMRRILRPHTTIFFDPLPELAFLINRSIWAKLSCGFSPGTNTSVTFPTGSQTRDNLLREPIRCLNPFWNRADVNQHRSPPLFGFSSFGQVVENGQGRQWESSFHFTSKVNSSVAHGSV